MRLLSGTLKQSFNYFIIVLKSKQGIRVGHWPQAGVVRWHNRKVITLSTDRVVLALVEVFRLQTSAFFSLSRTADDSFIHQTSHFYASSSAHCIFRHYRVCKKRPCIFFRVSLASSQAITFFKDIIQSSSVSTSRSPHHVARLLICQLPYEPTIKTLSWQLDGAKIGSFAHFFWQLDGTNIRRIPRGGWQ